MKKQVVPFILLICILVFVGVGLFISLHALNSTRRSDELTDDLTDEFSRARWFIVDWYNEVQDKGMCTVFLNELSFNGGKFTLTFSRDRIRAVFPKGERFFKLYLIKNIEFFEVNDVLRCRFTYGKSGEYMFRVN